MRKTLTIDDELAGMLQTMADQKGQSFKQVVNDVLRAGMEAGGAASPPRPETVVPAQSLELQPDYNPDKLNQLLDELEAEELARKQPMP